METTDKKASLRPLTAQELDTMEKALIRYNEHALGGKERGRVERLLAAVAAAIKEVEG